jgi:hypothetical protein
LSDVGEKFDDGVLTLEEYERVENLYLSAVRQFMEAAGSPDLLVSELQLAPLATPAAQAVQDGALLTAQEALEVCRLELREELSCRLDDDERFYVHVGMDYYVYLGTLNPSSAVVEAIEESGLFVEEGVSSPYFTD